MSVPDDDTLLFFTGHREALTLGLPAPLDSPRVAAKCEPCPGRWTHYFVLSSTEELNGEMMAWSREAYDFAESKRRRADSGDSPVRAGGSSTKSSLRGDEN